MTNSWTSGFSALALAASLLWVSFFSGTFLFCVSCAATICETLASNANNATRNLVLIIPSHPLCGGHMLSGDCQNRRNCQDHRNFKINTFETQRTEEAEDRQGFFLPNLG